MRGLHKSRCTVFQSAAGLGCSTFRKQLNLMPGAERGPGICVGIWSELWKCSELHFAGPS